MFRSANNVAPPTFGLFCNPESRRVEGFCAALGRAFRQRPIIFPWSSISSADNWDTPLNDPLEYLRLESPGRNWTVEKQLLLLGAGVEDEPTGAHYRRLDAEQVLDLENDPGRIHPQRQWFLGWKRALQRAEDWSKRHGLENAWLCPPQDVLCMFDKASCETAFAAMPASVPPFLGLPTCFDALWEMMRTSGCRRVFLKPCHSSSASGVVALEVAGNKIQAHSTVELIKGADGMRLYNRRRIQNYRGAAEVRLLVDAACRERVLAQAWIPKAGLQGRPFDLRVVVIGGRARQVMVRLGRGPFTNSQLLGGRGDTDLLRARMGETRWREMLELCERVMGRCFPDSLYAGLDVLIEPNFRKFWILEVNAFGDLLPRLLHENRDSYDWEISEALRRRKNQVSSMGA